MSAINKWKDITSRSRGDAYRAPSVFEAADGNLRICVLNSHRDYRPDWVMHCGELAIDTLHLPNAKTSLDAKRDALAIVFKKLSSLQLSASRIAEATVSDGLDGGKT